MKKYPEVCASARPISCARNNVDACYLVREERGPPCVDRPLTSYSGEKFDSCISRWDCIPGMEGSFGAVRRCENAGQSRGMVRFLALQTLIHHVIESYAYLLLYGQVATAKVLELLGYPSKWEEARSLLSSPPLSSADFAKILDRYSDSNWGNHILGDLYRNQGLANIKVTCPVSSIFSRRMSCKSHSIASDGMKLKSCPHMVQESDCSGTSVET